MSQLWEKKVRIAITFLIFLFRGINKRTNPRAWTHRHQRLTDGRQHVGPQRVQQQLVFGQDGQQQRTGVLRSQILQQLHKTGTTERRKQTNQNTAETQQPIKLVQRVMCLTWAAAGTRRADRAAGYHTERAEETQNTLTHTHTLFPISASTSCSDFPPSTRLTINQSLNQTQDYRLWLRWSALDLYATVSEEDDDRASSPPVTHVPRRDGLYRACGGSGQGLMTCGAHVETRLSSEQTRISSPAPGYEDAGRTGTGRCAWSWKCACRQTDRCPLTDEFWGISFQSLTLTALNVKHWAWAEIQIKLTSVNKRNIIFIVKSVNIVLFSITLNWATASVIIKSFPRNSVTTWRRVFVFH